MLRSHKLFTMKETKERDKSRRALWLQIPLHLCVKVKSWNRPLLRRMRMA